MAINSNVTRLIQPNQNRYKGVTPFQERALQYGQNKVDNLQKEIRDEESGLVYSMYDQGLAKPLIDEYQQRKSDLTKDFHISEISNIRDGLGELQQMRNDPRYQTLKDRQLDYQNYNSKLNKLVPTDAERYQRELALSQGSPIQDEQGNYITTPTSQLSIAPRPDMIGGTAALAKLTSAELSSIDPQIKEITYDRTGSPIVLLKNGSRQQLSESKLKTFFTNSVKNDPSYTNWLKKQDRHLQKGIITQEEYNQELQQIDNQINAVAKGASYSNTKENYQVLSNGLKVDANNSKEKLDENNASYPGLRIEQGTNKVYTNNNTLPPTVDEFNTSIDTLNSEVQSMVNQINSAYDTEVIGKNKEDNQYGNFLLDENGNYKTDLKIKDVVGTDEQGNPIYSETSRLMTQDEKNEANMLIESRNYVQKQNDDLYELALSDLNISSESFKKHRKVFNMSKEEKLKYAKENFNIDEKYEKFKSSYISSQELTPNLTQDVIDFNVEKYANKDLYLENNFNTLYKEKNNIDIESIENEVEDLYQDKIKNSLVPLKFTFTTPEFYNEKMVGSKAWEETPNQYKEAVVQTVVRQERYNSSPYEVLKNAKSVINDRGESINMDEAGSQLFLGKDLESNRDNPSEIELNPENSKGIKVDHQGFAYNKITQSYMEKVVFTGNNEDGEPIQKVLFVQDPEVDRINQKLDNTTSIQQVKNNLKAKLDKSGGTLITTIPETDLGYVITPNKNNIGNFNITMKGSRPGSSNDITINGGVSSKINHTAKYDNLSLDKLSEIIRSLNLLEFQGGDDVGK